MQFAIMGFGTVGSGVAELFLTNKKSIVKKCGDENFTLKRILDIRDFSNHELSALFTKDFNEILNDKDIDIVVETMGGLNPAFDFVYKCLDAGKSVVTSNKELVAAKGYELLQLAKKKNVNFLFEASVGGGIPIIRPINQCLAANEISEVAGILNGTTNFILKKMIDDGMSFEDALKLAQDNGYAERDPSADILGFDAARKICILASLCFGKHVYPDSVETVGITEITPEDIEYVNAWGGVIKLIGRAKKAENGKIYITVGPSLVKNSCLLSSVSDVFNAILVRGNGVGDVVFYGKGAGKLATASAVVADVIDCAQNIDKNKGLGWDDKEEGYVENPENQEIALYVRANTNDYALSVKEIANVFADARVLSNGNKNEIAFVTPVMKENDARSLIAKLPIEVKSILRVLDY